ncbi:hypothetical protein [Phragmitibacter flavus]|nr:hypothetical protein [Phragmitibacter flavus]
MSHKFKEYCSEVWTNSPLGTFERRVEVYQWGFHNIILGFAGIWVPLLALSFFGLFRKEALILSGDIPMFAVTLSAVSLGFFVKETQLVLRKRAIVTYILLMLTMIVGVIARSMLALYPTTPSLQLDMTLVKWVTIALVVIAVFSNFRLFMIQIDSTSPAKIQKEFDKNADQMSEQAKTGNQASGVRV